MFGKIIKMAVLGKHTMGRHELLIAIVHYSYSDSLGKTVVVNKDISIQVMSRISGAQIPTKFAIEFLPSMPLPEEIPLKEGDRGKYFPLTSFFCYIAYWLKHEWATKGCVWQEIEKKERQKYCA